MNAKIKALLEQSKEESKWLVGTSSPVYEVNQPKFAELIIQECLNTLHNNGYDDAAIELQKHFKE